MAKRTASGPAIDGLELKAAAAAAYVVGGRAHRRDLGGTRMRDFDLRYPDGRTDEPLEVTCFIDRAGLETWKRLGSKDSTAPALSRVWTVDVQSREGRADGSAGPYDVNRFLKQAEPLFRALEERGQHDFYVPGPPGDNVLEGLAGSWLRCRLSRAARPRETGRIEGVAPTGGVTHPDSAAWAIEHEAGKVDNQEKLSCSPNAERRHLFVIPHPSAVDAYLSVRHRRIGRVPALPAPITTAWVWDGDSPYVFMATPPSPWEDCELPSHLLAEPEMWVD